VSRLHKCFPLAGSIAALVVLCLLMISSPGRAADPRPEDKSPPATVQTPPPAFTPAQEKQILADKELEKKALRLPSRYRIRNAPSTAADPTWSGDQARALGQINRLNRGVNQSMRSLDNSIRNMNININRTRTYLRRY
jgi:hypothetical protein